MTTVRATCEHVDALREPSKSHAIHKAECTKCYDTDESETGLNVCLTCFNGGCTGASQHSAQHSKVANHPVVVNIRKVEVEQEVVPAKGDKITKLAITEEDVFEPKYEYVTKIRCLKCDCELEKAGKLQKIVDAVLASEAATKTSIITWENKAKPCPHAETLVQNPDAPKLASKSLSKCQSCDIASDLWLCLTCGALGCSRDQGGGKGGNGHALAHGSKDTAHHPLVIKVGTITPEGGASAYCYACNDDVVDSQLAKHLAHFGIDMATQEKTAKTMDELNVDANNNLNLNKVTDKDGKEAALMYGPGFCGFRNLGNSCYMASSLQVLYSLPTFQARYLGEGREHLANCRQSRPADCFQCQLSKVAYGIYSGRYNREPTPAILAAIEEEKKRVSRETEAAATAEAPAAAAPATDGKEREVKKATRKSTPDLQPGVRPAMFKKFIAKDHYEFSTGKQQDALEFIHYFFEQIQRAERAAGVDPTAAFNFQIEDRLQCTQCQRVRYQSAKATELSLPIPLVEIKKQLPADATPGKKPEIEYAPAPFGQCLEQWSAEQSMEDYACPQCNTRTRAIKRQRFESFPEVLMVQMRRFVFDNWVPAKVSAEVLVDREIKLDDLRGRGLQPGEVELPAAKVAAGPVKTANPEFVSMIEGMGLGKNLAIRACLAVDNASAEVALNWAMEHMGDDGVNDPIAEPKAAPSGKPNPPEDLVTNLMGMGFDRNRCVYALGETNNNLERAIDWLFSHADDPLPSAPSAAAEAKSSGPKDTKPAKYRLVGFITHQGRSTGSGHYVAHLLKEGKWVKFNDNKVSVESELPSGQAYLYFFRRV